MTKRQFSILDAMGDEKLFAPAFRDPDSWASWRSWLAALFALPMTEDMLATYRECTGRSAPPATAQREAWLVIGRRGGKSRMMALVAVYLACFRDYRKHLATGERCTIMVVASDRRQSRTILRYVSGFLNEIPMLARMIQSARADA
jgi:hypothetical protein